MNRKTLPDWSHSILGTFKRSAVTNPLNQTFFDLEKKEQTIVSGLGFTFDRFSIRLQDVPEPSSEMLADLIAMVTWPRSRLHEIEDRIFAYYQENRPRWLEEHQEISDITAEMIARCVPEIVRRDQVWQLLEQPVELVGGVWEHPSLAFECTFDIDHMLRVSFSSGHVARVWNE